MRVFPAPASPTLALFLVLFFGGGMVEAGERRTMAPADRPLVSGERVRVQKLTRDMESARQTLDQGGVTPFQDPAHVQKWRDALARYATALGKYPQADDPDVRAARAKYAELEAMVAFGVQEAARRMEELGDVQATLASIEARLRAKPVPARLGAPFDLDEARAWVADAVAARTTAEAALAEIRRIAPTAHLPLTRGTVEQGAPYDRQDLDRLTAMAERAIAGVGRVVDETTADLKSAFDRQDDELNHFRGLDPADPQDRMNAYLADGAAARLYGALDRQQALAHSVAAYQRAFGKEPTPATAARIEEIEELRRRYARDRLAALGSSRLPEPKSTDTGRLDVARRILAHPDYGFGAHGPIVLTSEAIVEREKRTSHVEIDELDMNLSGTLTASGTETVWTWRWREFTFATPIRDADGGDWYVWWITARNFSSGSERTPIGRWVSGAAVKGDLIPEENFRP
ncbi:MAG: hypothetical protein KDE35_03365 [Geminicoccaceae bacterium]|nr:hypothetical protein [Geminicoccaceae bacterium]